MGAAVVHRVGSGSQATTKLHGRLRTTANGTGRPALKRLDDSLDYPLTGASYYAATVTRPGRFAPLRGAVDADVCVVGGGLAGLSASIELAQRGYRVVLLEAHEVGWGASGRNGGQALVGLSCEMDVVARQLGAAGARQVWGMTVEAIELIQRRRRQFSIDCDWQDGFIAAAVTPAKARALHAWCDQLARDYGYDRMQPIERGALRQWIDSPRYAGAAFDPYSGHLHPLKYTFGLALAAAGLGVSIHEHSRALRIARGAAPAVHSADGQVRCASVLLAGNVYLGALAPQLAARIMPVGTFIAASAPLDPAVAHRLIPNRAAVSDTQFVLDYYRLSADNRLLFGGRVSYSRLAPADLADAMRRRMLAVFPQLAPILPRSALEFAWGGLVDITMNRAPDFGRIDANVYYLQGFSGHGLALSGIAGTVAAEAIAGHAERFDLFARLKHRRFPGGRLLRTPALVLAMLWFRLRDLVG